MKLSQYKEDYYLFTGKLSDINRQAAFAGIALIWIFKEKDSEGFIVCSDLVWPAIFLIASLGTDMLQYIYQSIAWSVFYRKHEKENNKKEIEDRKKIEEIDVDASPRLNYLTWALFGVKIILVIIAYTLIILFLKSKLLK